MNEKLSLTELRSLWRYYDIDGNGYLEYREFRELLEAIRKKDGLESPLPDEFLQQCYTFVDQNRNGVVVYKEFIENFNTYWTNRKQILETFYRSGRTVETTTVTKSQQTKRIGHGSDKSTNEVNQPNQKTLATPDELSAAPGLHAPVRDAKTEQCLLGARREVSRLNDDVMAIQKVHDSCSETISNQLIDLENNKMVQSRLEERVNMMEKLCSDLEGIRDKLNSDLDKERNETRDSKHQLSEANQALVDLESKLNFTSRVNNGNMDSILGDLSRISCLIKKKFKSCGFALIGDAVNSGSIDYDDLFSMKDPEQAFTVVDTSNPVAGSRENVNRALNRLNKDVLEFSEFYRTLGENMKSEYASVMKELSDTKRRESQLRNEKIRLEDEHKQDVDALNRSLENMNRQLLEERERHGDAYRSSNAIARAAKLEATSLKHSIDELKSQNIDLNQKQKGFQNDTRDIRCSLEKSRNRVAGVEFEKKELEQTLDSLSEEKELFCVTMGKLECELAKMNCKLEDLVSEKNELLISQEDMKNGNAKVLGEVKMFRDKLTKQEAESRRLTEENWEIKSGRTKLRQRLEESDHYRQKLQILTKSNSLLKGDSSCKKAEILDLQFNLSECTHKNSSLTRALDSIKDELKDFRTELDSQKRLWLNELVPNTIAEIREDTESLKGRLIHSENGRKGFQSVLTSVCDEILGLPEISDAYNSIESEEPVKRSTRIRDYIHSKDIQILRSFLFNKGRLDSATCTNLRDSLISSIRCVVKFFESSILKRERFAHRLKGANRDPNHSRRGSYSMNENYDGRNSFCSDTRPESVVGTNPYSLHSPGVGTVNFEEEELSPKTRGRSDYLKRDLSGNLVDCPHDGFVAKSHYGEHDTSPSIRHHNTVSPTGIHAMRNSNVVLKSKRPSIHSDIHILRSILNKKYGSISRGFDSIDSNRSGKLCLTEIEAAVRGPGLTSVMLRRIFDAIDVTRDGVISKREFVSMCSSVR